VGGHLRSWGCNTKYDRDCRRQSEGVHYRICALVGVGAGIFLGVRKNCPQILPNFPEKYFKFMTSKKKLSVRAPCDLQKKAFHVNSDAIIFKSKHVGRHFCSDFHVVLEGSHRFYPGFRDICPDFMGFCPFFHQIKTFGGAVAPPCTPSSYTSVCTCTTGMKQSVVQ